MREPRNMPTPALPERCKRRHGRPRHWNGIALLGLWFCCSATGATAQGILPDERPGDRRQPLPPFEQPQPLAEDRILPAFPIPEVESTDPALAGAQVEVREIEIEGNTVVPSEVLAEVARPYTMRRLSYAELQTLRDRLTAAYVARGYVTSGATLPAQTLADGVLRVQIIEGRLGEIDVEVDGRLRPSYFRSRLAHEQGGILNVNELERQLQLFQQNEWIESVGAHLEPTSVRGVARLNLVVKEAPFFAVGADFDNYRSPSIGSLGGTARLSVANLIGVGDSYQARFTGSEGLRQAEARFEVPFTVWDTLFGARYQYSQGDVVDDAFEALGIESEAETVGFVFSQPLYRSAQSFVGLEFHADWRRAQSFLFGGAIGLPTAYSEDGKSQETVLRFGLDASYRTRSQSLAFRSLLSWGLDALGATVNPGDVPDGRFVSWLGQLQWASRLPWLGAQVLTRFEIQLADQPLLPLEQFAIGGRYSVRGYRENLLVRDNGLAGSFEVRLPVYRQSEAGIRIELVPFADIGHSWNNDRPRSLENSSPETIASVGLGTRMLLTRWGFAELYWGHRLNKVRNLGESDLQDDGIHFRLGLGWP